MLPVSSQGRPRAPRKTGRIVLIRDGQVVRHERPAERPAPAAHLPEGMAARAMGRTGAASNLAPPISPPSTSGWLNRCAALSGLTLPPYRRGSAAATFSPKVLARKRRP